jgi:hypothetical protein
MNTAPLELAPIYANDTLHGVGDNQYWPEKPTNHTQIAETMREYTTSVNTIMAFQTPFELLVANRYPGAHFALFDTHSLMSDIYHSPTQYLNGTGVVAGGESVWGYENHCTVDQTSCVKRYNGTNPDAFLWFDELHPRYVGSLGVPFFPEPLFKTLEMYLRALSYKDFGKDLFNFMVACLRWRMIVNRRIA